MIINFWSPLLTLLATPAHDWARPWGGLFNPTGAPEGRSIRSPGLPRHPSHRFLQRRDRAPIHSWQLLYVLRLLPRLLRNAGPRR